MAKVIFEYDPNEPDDMHGLALIQRASDLHSALWDIYEYTRSQLKYHELSEETQQHLEELNTLAAIVLEFE